MISIIIPHYAVGKICAYSISKILEYKGNFDVEIIVVDNKPNDLSSRYLRPFFDKIKYVTYPANKLQSHGIGTSWVIDNGYAKGDYFLTMENDSFPISNNFLKYYYDIIEQEYDAAGSVLRLSGGSYLHGCGSLYSRKVYDEARDFVSKIPYTYFPNMAKRDGFDSHLMIHNNYLNETLDNIVDWVELSEHYKTLNKCGMLGMAEHYSPTNCVFHNGMGGLNESVNTYGLRCAGFDSPHILIPKEKRLIYRVGYEPSQFLYYFMVAMNKKIFEIPIEVKWMEGRENQQQEYTLNEAGVKHIWAISSYTERGSNDVEDIYKIKTKIPDELYETLPPENKI